MSARVPVAFHLLLIQLSRKKREIYGINLNFRKWPLLAFFAKTNFSEWPLLRE